MRMIIQCWSSQPFAGNVTSPEKTAPAASSSVSPQFALLMAVCRLLPALTSVVAPGAGVSAKLVDMKTRGNSAGPSKLLELGVGDGVAAAATASENEWLAVLFAESVTCAVKLKLPLWVVVPLRCPVLLKPKPCGSEPPASTH